MIKKLLIVAVIFSGINLVYSFTATLPQKATNTTSLPTTTISSPTTPSPTPKDILQIDNDSVYFLLDDQKILFDLRPVDYAGPVLISPDKKFACVEYGTSGYWGYHIFDINKQKTILSGEQYSYCQNWTSSNKIIVRETPYSTNITTIFSINPTTLKKTLIIPDNSTTN